MPVEVGKLVLKCMKPVERLVCRKVCRSLRTAVDSFGIRFNRVSVDLYDDYVLMDLNGLTIKYKSEENGNSAVYCNGKRIAREEDFLEVAFEDLIAVLNHTSHFFFKNERKELLITSVTEILKNKKNLCVKEISLNKFSFDDALLILPCFNAQVLESIELWEAAPIDRCERLTGLDQWKMRNVSEFTILGLKVNT